MTKRKEVLTCEICGEKFGILSLKKHLAEHKIDFEDYVRQYYSEKGTGYCKNCGKPVHLINFTKGFHEFCSRKCSANFHSTKEKRKETCLDKYGTEFATQNKKIKEKTKETNLQNYGYVSTLQDPVVQKKIEKTCLDRYGTKHASSSKEVQEKIRATTRKRFGTDFAIQNEAVKKKSEETSVKHYGVKHSLQAKEVKEQIKKTNYEKYGTENPLSNKEIQEKIKKTNQILFGVDNVFSSSEIQEKIKKTNLDRFGTKFASQNEAVKKKTEKTCLEKYGTKFPSKSEKVKKKIKRILREKNYLSNKKTLLSLKNIVLLDTKEEYINNTEHNYHCNTHKLDFISEETNSSLIFCPKCYESTISKGELELFDFVSSHVGNCLHDTRSVLANKHELDIYIPDKNLAIEFDGLYWHSNVFKDKNYHLKKTEECNSKGIQLLHVFENEWMFKKDIVKSIILSKLGIYKERLFARKCHIQEVNSTTAKQFLEENHLQGSISSNVKLGLFYKKRLVQLCCFGKSRYKKGETELLRQCTLKNTQIVGGMSKLLKYYINRYNPERLVTYCDRRYSNGKGYISSGWKQIDATEPNYFYWKNNYILESRIKFQKHKLSGLLETFDSYLSEKENMLLNGYNYIYDCGNYKFEYQKTLKG